jgi:hypothetical protein
MRLVFLCGVTTSIAALLLAGCGVEKKLLKALNVDSPEVTGRAFGGQQPVVGATMSVVAMGTSGYGSTGTVLASTITDSGGNFSFAPGAYTCPQSDTPVYLMGVGGNAGAGNNQSAVLAAGIGTCAGAENSYTIVNEVTTVGLAFTLSHFFSTTLGGANGANDWFGGPSTMSDGTVQYSRGLVVGNNVTIPTIVFNAIGQANQTGTNASGTTYTVEWQKINTIANILLSCINSSGSTSTTEIRTPCGRLFRYTRVSSDLRPSDTLQAAVQMALHPSLELANLFNLASATSQFTPSLTSVPNDWTIGVSFSTPSLGLAVDTGTQGTLDIDASGKIWFPSNAAAKAGAAYFDPVSQSFDGPFNSTGLVHPQQVAIDANGYAWFNDSATSTVAGYLVAAPATTQTASLPNTVSNALTVGGDNRINVGITNASLYELANISADRTTYTLTPGITYSFPVTSMAGDRNDGDALSITSAGTTQMRSYYVTASPPSSTQFVVANDDSGQVIYIGNDFLAVRSYSGVGNANDGLCIFSGSCHNFRGGLQNTAKGMVIDGARNLWVAERAVGGVLQVPVNDPDASGGAIYVNPNGNNVPNNEFLHGTDNGGTATLPCGIGIDVTGNVWMTNAGCTTTGCTPGSFLLTEIIGAATPTITPISAQITSGTNLVGTEPTN